MCFTGGASQCGTATVSEGARGRRLLRASQGPAARCPRLCLCECLAHAFQRCACYKLSLQASSRPTHAGTPGKCALSWPRGSRTRERSHRRGAQTRGAVALTGSLYPAEWLPVLGPGCGADGSCPEELVASSSDRHRAKSDGVGAACSPL